jgi:hypothetical protein
MPLLWTMAMGNSHSEEAVQDAAADSNNGADVQPASRSSFFSKIAAFFSTVRGQPASVPVHVGRGGALHAGHAWDHGRAIT